MRTARRTGAREQLRDPIDRASGGHGRSPSLHGSPPRTAASSGRAPPAVGRIEPQHPLEHARGLVAAVEPPQTRAVPRQAAQE